MRAIVLVGGAGTRLRPLTDHLPKPLVPIAGRPLLEHVFVHLAEHGVGRITLATTRRSAAIQSHFGSGDRLGLELSYAYEDSPLGSGGAIATAAAGWTERFLVLNGDVMSDLDISRLVDSHVARGARVTIALHEVPDPSPYGVVALAGDDRIARFVEKPSPAVAPSRWINAGVWLFEPSVLSELDATRFSRVEDDLFPGLATRREAIYGFKHPGSWIDVGTLETYHRANMEALDAHRFARGADDRLPGCAIDESARVESGVELIAPLAIGPGTVIRSGAVVNGRVAIGRDCVVAAGAKIQESVIWDQVRIGEDAIVERSVVASEARIQEAAVVAGSVIPHAAAVSASDPTRIPLA